MPLMLSEILHEVLATEGDIELVGGIASPDDVLGQVEHTDPDIVVLGVEDGAPPAILFPLLCGDPTRRKIFGVHIDGREGFVYELRPYGRRISDLSATTLLHAIRDAKAPRFP
jgi:hypothetical protein